jgi:hypothetical protein
LIDSLTAGGAEALVAPFARAWPGELRVCCLKSIGGNPFEAEVRATNLEAKNLRDLGAFRRLLRLLREERIELIHAHLAYASIWGALAGRITGIPCVATLHVAPSGAAPRSKEGIREALMVHALNRWATRVIAVSASAREAWIERGLKKVVVVGNGIEVDALHPRQPWRQGRHYRLRAARGQGNRGAARRDPGGPRQTSGSAVPHRR